MAVRISAAGRTITVSDDVNGGYTAVGGVLTVTTNDFNVYYRGNAGSGTTTVTVSISGAAATIRFAIHEYSGAAASPFDKTQGQSQSTPGTAVDSGTAATTTQADELIFGAFGTGISGTPASSFTAGSSIAYNKRISLVSGIQLKIGTEDCVVSSTGAYKADATLDASDDWMAIVATFKAAGLFSRTLLINQSVNRASTY